MLDKLTAQKLADEFKIDIFTIYREYLQLLFLKYFYQQKRSDQVFFKGGTALRFLYGSFRFSEDLDFTSLLAKQNLKELISKTLKALTKEAGYVSFKQEKTIAFGFRARIFQDLEDFKFPLTIRLDFSLREKPFLTTTSLIETSFPVGSYPQVLHLKIEEIMAEKIRAILTRTRGRDIFDLWFILSKNVPIDWELVNQKMKIYQKRADLRKLIQKVKSFPQQEIKNDLTRFLPLNYRALCREIKQMLLEKLKPNH